MSPADVVIARLQDITGVTMLVSTRIYQLKLPQKPTLPAIRVQEIDTMERFHLRGPASPIMARVQVDAFYAEISGGDPLESVHALADAIHGDGLGTNATGLSGWIGDVGGSPATHVHGMFRQDRADSYEGDELRIVRTRQDYLVHMT